MSSKLKIDTRVRSLKNYLEEFEQGVFQIPSFQRDFLWSQDDIKQLFDSIKSNYPIGSILFWKPLENAKSFIDDNDPKIGPYKYILKEKKDPVFILDGLQRLTSLFGCLINPKKTNLNLINSIWEGKFNLYYDLEEQKFIYLRQKSRNLPFQVPVYIFMNSIDFRQYARKEFEKIDDENKIEQYYDRADEIGQIFNNYQIASVDIEYASIDEAVEIFKRVNEKGLPIAKDWIVSALTNKGNFRLGTEIDNLLDELKLYNYENIKRDIIFQCIQSSFGKIYFDYKIEELVVRDDFEDVTVKTLKSVKKAVEFLYENLLVLNSKLIPYNSQLIFLTVFFNSMHHKELSYNQIISLKKWFWITSYSNYFTIYSLSNQRKAFEKFNQFIIDENVNPVFYDNENNFFMTLDFPNKIGMGSVRAKSLALFMINYSQGIKEISLQKINAENVGNFESGSLFSKPQKDNPSENFIPVVENLEIENGKRQFILLTRLKRPKNYSSLLNKEYENLFITSKMVDEYNNDLNSDDLILRLRREVIVDAEKKFVEKLDIFYNVPIDF
ncbi:uncharacterized protein DUF262 [Flavobacterium sp. 1]|uniref:DUF262 domain-containing protein n=1 Tax=Flavobacterium sp. 1 TaxID=2035200 RepID=UPI000C23108C|nr:DUF262 domain-containing protein [Flavobacterium sp. 1]PJJ08825.1 uncharacterized protein DUF262 [Flavobacterium sp. 1]